jgi:hypothetical protein
VDLGRRTEADRDDRIAAIKKAIDRPGVHIDGSKIRASKAAFCSVEVLVDGAGLRAQNNMGQAFVPLNKKHSYVVRVTNHSAQDAAVSLRIDGLDVLTFSEVKDPRTGLPRYRRYIVRAGESITIRGWHRTNEHSTPFQGVDFKDNALAKVAHEIKLLRGSPAVGTLTVCFRLAWDADRPPPGRPRKADGGTAIGPRSKKGAEVRIVIGALREVVSVRYRKPK